MKPTDRIYPDTVLHLNGHHVVIPAYLDPVRQFFLGELDEVGVFEPLRTARTERVEAQIGHANCGARRGGSEPERGYRGIGEHRSHTGPGPGNGPSKTETPKPNGRDGSTVTGGRSVTPNVAPVNAKNPNGNTHVAEVAEPGGDSADGPHFPGTTPHHEPDLATLLDEVAAVINKYVSLRHSMMYTEAVALWIVGTHAFQWSNIFPRLVATSPEPGCGKSTLMKLMLFLCPHTVLSSHATEPAIVRRIKRAKQKIVLLLDDAESFVDGSHTSLLNAGFDRYGGQFLRCEPSKAGKWADEEFNPYVPIAMARISKTPVKSTRTRCLEINLQRAKKGEYFQRFEPDIAKVELEYLRHKMANWADANGHQLKACDPAVPAELANRNADVWRFLLAIADLGGLRWSERARAAAVVITRNISDEDPALALRSALAQGLVAIRDKAWLASNGLSLEKLAAYETASGELRIPSAGLCLLLRAVSPKHSNLKPTKLAQLLAPFDVHPGSINLGAKRLRGYKEEDLKDMLERYGAGDFADGYGYDDQ